MKPRKVSDILKAYKDKGYWLDERPFAMNIFGIRANSTESDKFDDLLGYIYKDGAGRWNAVQSAGTTDTGTYWLKNPELSKGTALLVAGQYRNAYAIGTHAQKYTAFRQVKDVKVLRDNNRDNILDFNNGTPDVGLFGINLHRASLTGKNYSIGKYSAGCQVWQKASDFEDSLSFAKKHRERYENQFTYTLFDERADFRRRLRFGAAGVLALLLSYVTYKLLSNKK